MGKAPQHAQHDRLGSLSAEVQESLQNFKVIVAFNRLEYFQRKFKNANDLNYTASVSAGFANNIFMPMYGFAHNLAMLLVVAYGITLIGATETTAAPLPMMFRLLPCARWFFCTCWCLLFRTFFVSLRCGLWVGGGFGNFG